MSDLKPIEVGCLAVTINCECISNNNRFVTVIEDLGVDGVGHHFWCINQKLKNGKGGLSNRISGKKLMRLDDPDLKDEIEEELVYIEDIKQ